MTKLLSRYVPAWLGHPVRRSSIIKSTLRPGAHGLPQHLRQVRGSWASDSTWAVRWHMRKHGTGPTAHQHSRRRSPPPLPSLGHACSTAPRVRLTRCTDLTFVSFVLRPVNVSDPLVLLPSQHRWTGDQQSVPSKLKSFARRALADLSEPQAPLEPHPFGLFAQKAPNTRPDRHSCQRLPGPRPGGSSLRCCVGRSETWLEDVSLGCCVTVTVAASVQSRRASI